MKLHVCFEERQGGLIGVSHISHGSPVVKVQYIGGGIGKIKYAAGSIQPSRNPVELVTVGVVKHDLYQSRRSCASAGSRHGEGASRKYTDASGVRIRTRRPIFSLLVAAGTISAAGLRNGLLRMNTGLHPGQPASNDRRIVYTRVCENGCRS